MNKEMFLQELRDRLLVLNEQERNDLLEEYAQHIDLKIENGLSEEEAVKDFGSLDELCTELLDVYHINSEYASGTAVQDKGEGKGVDFVDKIRNSISVSRLKKDPESHNVKTEEQLALEREEKLQKEQERKQKREQKKEQNREKMIRWKEQRKVKRDARKEIHKEKLAVMKVRHQTKMQERQERKLQSQEQRLQNGGSGVGRLMRKTWKGFVFLTILFWKFCLFCAVSPVIFIGLTALFCTGTAAVLLQQGYPLIGVTLFGAGVFLAAAGLSGLVLSYVFSWIKHHKIMMILLLAGVLTGGIGTGTALVELSDMEYNKTIWLGTENTEMEKFIYELETQEVDEVYCYIGMNTVEGSELVEDRKVPLDEIWFEVEYNPEYCEPSIDQFTSYENGDFRREEVHIWTRTGRQDSLETFFSIKDQLLEELKNKKISSYQFAPVVGMKVYVHPSNTDKLKLF